MSLPDRVVVASCTDPDADGIGYKIIPDWGAGTVALVPGPAIEDARQIAEAINAVRQTRFFEETLVALAQEYRRVARLMESERLAESFDAKAEGIELALRNLRSIVFHGK